jgi:hypothetical protein
MEAKGQNKTKIALRDETRRTIKCSKKRESERGRNGSGNFIQV